MIDFIVYCAVALFLPASILLFNWFQKPAVRGLVIAPAIATVLLALSVNRHPRWVLLGPDYSDRLYLTIEIVAGLSLVNAIYAAIKRAWTVAAAALLMSIAWLYLGIVNSVV